MNDIDDSRAQLKAIANSQKGLPEPLYHNISTLAISLVMGYEQYLRRFDSEAAIPLLVSVAERAVESNDHGDVMALTLRSLSLIFEHVPSSYDAAQAYHKQIIKLASTALHKALCAEWKYNEVDTRAHVEECLRVLRFVSKDDRTGSALQHALVGDILTLCASPETLVARQALETLSMMCNKVAMNSEIEKPSNSSGGFFSSLFKSKKKKAQQLEQQQQLQDNNPIVVCVENVVAPFLLTLTEQFVSELHHMPEVWVLLEMVLTCMNVLMDRALLCHRPSTARAIACPELPALVFQIISILEDNMALDEATRRDRVLFCESMLATLTTCNRQLMADAVLLPDAKKFLRSILEDSSRREVTTLLDDPFPKGSMAARSTQNRDKDHITSIAAIRLFVLVCPTVPPEAFGLKPKVALPIHQWMWEDDLRHANKLVEEQSVALETSWNRLSKQSSVSVHLKALDVDLHSMTMARGFHGGHRNISRITVPFVFHLVDEAAVRPVVPAVKNAGPEALPPSKRSSSLGKKRADSNGSFASSPTINEHAFVPESHIAIADEYLALLCDYATYASGQLAKQVAMCACASVLQMMLLTGARHRVAQLMERVMLPICEMFCEALHTADKATKAVVLTMIDWMLHHPLTSSLSFSETSLRCGLVNQLQRLSTTTPSVSIGKDARPTRTADMADRASCLFSEMDAKLAPKMKSGTGLLMSKDLGKLKGAVDQLAAVPSTSDNFEKQLSNLFEALKESAHVTPYEAHQIHLASVVLSFLLGGKTTDDLFGQSVIYTSGASGSTFSASSRATFRSLTATQEEQYAPTTAMIARGMRVGDLLDSHMSRSRVKLFVKYGHENPQALQLLIEHLVGTLPLENSLPLVESLISHEKVSCSSPVQAFQALSDISPRVVLCGKAGQNSTDVVPPTSERPATASAATANMTAAAISRRTLSLQQQQQRRSSAPLEDVSAGNFSADGTPMLNNVLGGVSPFTSTIPPNPKEFCMRGHRFKYTHSYRAQCACDVCKKSIRSGYGCRLCNFDICKECYTIYEGNATLLEMLLSNDKLPKNRAHFVSSIGDIERFFRTGSSTTKATQVAPTSQSYLQHINRFSSRTETFLSRKLPTASRETVTVIRLLLQNQQMLRQCVYDVLATFFTRGVLPGNPSEAAAATEDESAVGGGSSSGGGDKEAPQPVLSDKQKVIAEQLIKEAVEDRYILYRPTSGLLPYQETFLSVVYRRALAMGNRQVLLQLENCLLHLESSQEPLTLKPTNAAATTPTPTAASPPISMTKREQGIGFTKVIAGAGPERVEEFTGNKIAAQQTFVFHHFESDDDQMCMCGAHCRTDFSVDELQAKSFSLPDFARRTDILLLIYMHMCFYSFAPPSSSSTLSSSSSTTTTSKPAGSGKSSLLPDPSVFVNSYITTTLVKSLEASALRVSVLPPKYALPRWVNFIITDARFLIPLRVRERISRYLAYDARRAFVQHMRLFRQYRFDRTLSVIPGEWARLSNHKYVVRRENLLSDAHKVLRKSAESRFPISIEFEGDVGVGQGPTAQFYTLVAKELSKAKLNMWRNVTIPQQQQQQQQLVFENTNTVTSPLNSPPLPPATRSPQTRGKSARVHHHHRVPPSPRQWIPDGGEQLIIPPPEGLYPRRWQPVGLLPPPLTLPSAVSTPDRGARSSAGSLLTDVSASVTPRSSSRRMSAGKIVLTDVRATLQDYVESSREKAKAYYLVGAAMGRAFVDEQVLPLALSSALSIFIRRGVPPFQLTVDPSLNVDECAELPIDLMELPVRTAGLVDASVANSLAALEKCDAATLKSLEIPFTLPGDDDFDLVPNGSNIFVTKANIKRYQHRVVDALLYESVALPMRFITCGCRDVVPREALTVLEIHELINLLCGESKASSEPLWTSAEVRGVLVGDHGYQNDSPQIEMLANILSTRLTPQEQRAFLLFCTGCPRLPLGGIHALGAITVVRRSNAFMHARSRLQLDQTLGSEMEDEDGVDGMGDVSEGSRTSVVMQDDFMRPSLFSGDMTEDGFNELPDSEWALPSVNTCFRYLKLPPYPTEELMYQKLILSITQCGDTFELS